MNKSELYKALNYVNHSREKRMEMATLVIENSSLVAPLLQIAMEVNDPISCRACWVLEFTSKEKLSFIFPHINTFTAILEKVYLQPAVRPIAKICERLIISYFTVDKNRTQEVLTDAHLQTIATACFDWLIGEHKVAAKAYSMTSLLLLGQKYTWIHPELKLVLEQNYAQGSAAYKARARHTLAKLK